MIKSETEDKTEKELHPAIKGIIEVMAEIIADKYLEEEKQKLPNSTAQLRTNFNEVFNSSEELIRYFEKLDNRVPGREDKARKYAIEIYGLERYLLALNSLKSIAYPIQIKHDDRPDFIISTDDKVIGLEITESTESEFNPWLARLEKEEAKTNCKPGCVSYSEDGYAGDSVEKRCANVVCKSVLNKYGKIAQYKSQHPEITHFALSTYINLDITGDTQRIIKYLNQVKLANLESFQGFQHILVIANKKVLICRPKGGFIIANENNL